MIPPRNFPVNYLTLVELEDNKIVKTHERLVSTNRNRDRLQKLRNDLLMVNPKLELQLRENNA
jgi:hypothetical protein